MSFDSKHIRSGSLWRCALALLCSSALAGCGALGDPEEAAGEGPGEGTPPGAVVLAGGNLAAGRPAIQSSSPWGSGAELAVDGNTDGDWGHGSVTATGLDAGAWWQVDLGAVVDIGKVILHDRTDCCTERLADFDVLVSRDGVVWHYSVHVGAPAPVHTVHFPGEPARFVRVRLRGTNYLSLAEVQVFAAQNLAAGRPATQSSSPWGSGAELAVDGNTDGDWGHGSVTATGLDAGAWWQVDLGAVADIGGVALYNRTDCCSGRLANFDIQLSSDGLTWTTRTTFEAAAPTRIGFAITGSGRFVRVRLRGTDYLSLAEVQVIAR